MGLGFFTVVALCFLFSRDKKSKRNKRVAFSLPLNDIVGNNNKKNPFQHSFPPTLMPPANSSAISDRSETLLHFIAQIADLHR